jgi:hypothetical protein
MAYPQEYEHHRHDDGYDYNYHSAPSSFSWIGLIKVIFTILVICLIIYVGYSVWQFIKTGGGLLGPNGLLGGIMSSVKGLVGGVTGLAGGAIGGVTHAAGSIIGGAGHAASGIIGGIGGAFGL